MVLLSPDHSFGMKILPGPLPLLMLLKQGQVECTPLPPECLLHLAQFLPAIKGTCV